MTRFGFGLACLWAAAVVVVGAPVRLATRGEYSSQYAGGLCIHADCDG